MLKNIVQTDGPKYIKETTLVREDVSFGGPSGHFGLFLVYESYSVKTDPNFKLGERTKCVIMELAGTCSEGYAVRSRLDTG